ncbi:hypothetical protein [Desulfamplus magnetovallimortis]|nr:hypothetical protein [Desulfamplus magnetovallimortis]
MNTFYVFIARIILGMVFGILITRIFRPEWTIFHGVAMGAGLVAVAYVMSMIRQKNKKG